MNKKRETDILISLLVGFVMGFGLMYIYHTKDKEITNIEAVRFVLKNCVGHSL